MKAHDRLHLEAAIGRELKRLPELTAPESLASRVMAGIQRPVPWYRQPWPKWPAASRAVFLTLLLAVFGGLCFAGWQLLRSEQVATAGREVDGWFAQIGVLWGAVRVLLESLVLTVRQMGTGFIVACFMAVALGYAACVGLGTLVARFAFARR